MYLFIARKNYWVALIPGAFMLYTTTVYILNAEIGFRQSMNVSYIVGAVISVILVIVFFKAAQKARAAEMPLEVDISDYHKVA
jgi:carbon starvation protein CstA